MTARFHLFFNHPAVKQALAPKKLKFLRRWGGWVRRTARSSIKRKGAARPRPKKKYLRGGSSTWTVSYRRWWQEVKDQPASPPGTPPYTHTGRLKKAILFAYNRATESVVVGPSERITDIGGLHEKGGRRRGRRYPARPFMRPARQKSIPKLAGFG
jgi:phage gpG-like protein